MYTRHRPPPTRAARPAGFTLLELMTALAVAAVLAGLATLAYRDHLVRGQLAQQLVDIDQIRSVVLIESRTGRRDLQVGSRPGAAPPALAGTLPDRAFAGPESLRLQLVRIPAGFFPATPRDGSYGLVADVTDAAGLRRLQLFFRQLESTGFERAWLGPRSFVFSIETFGSAGSGGGGGGDGGGGDGGGGGGSSCPPGWSAVGNSGLCRPPAGEPCPPGWSPVGNSGLCRPPENAR